MIKLAFDYYDERRKEPFPNLTPKAVREYYNSNPVEEILRYDPPTPFPLKTTLGQFWQYLPQKYETVILNKHPVNINRDDFFLYTFGLYGDHNNLLASSGYKTSSSGVQYNVGFLNNVSPTAINLCRNGQLKFVVNYAHEPFSDYNFLKRFQKDLDIYQLSLEKDFLFFVGSSNFFDRHPETKGKYNIICENTPMTDCANVLEEMKIRAIPSIGFKSELIHEHELDTLREKHFITMNKTQKPHRLSIGCLFESKNMWDKVYASFLQTGNLSPTLTGDDILDNELKIAKEKLFEKMPIVLDSHGFAPEEIPTTRSFKKELYLNSYIYIVTETVFNDDVFISEKICNPIIVLQPFIVVAGPGYLKYLRDLGFKTFNGFIDESYDDIVNNHERMRAILKEIERISNMPIEDLHNWYQSIKPIVIHNRNLLSEKYARRELYIDNLEKFVRECKNASTE
jgi:hypothetical protein